MLVTMSMALLLGRLVSLAAGSNKSYHWDRNAPTGHRTLTTLTSQDDTVVRVITHNPPINLYHRKLAQGVSEPQEAA
jgi:hypothetical protein